MIEYNLEIELLSETILGSGESVPGIVDLEILYDECGLPYYKAKSLKGKLREEAENIVRLQRGIFSNNLVDELFGYPDKNNMNKITFSNACVSQNIKNLIKKNIEAYNISSEDILKALTDIRYFTAINNNGVADNGTLREIRTIKKDLTLVSTVYALEDLTDKEEKLLALSVASLKHLGLLGSRGKGQVNCRLFLGNEDITQKAIMSLLE